MLEKMNCNVNIEDCELNDEINVNDANVEPRDFIKELKDEIGNFENDIINNPSHYRESSVMLEPIDVAEVLTFDQGSAFTYVCRFSHKHKDDPTVDLRKALWYLNRELENVTVLNSKMTAEMPYVLRVFCRHTKNPILKEAFMMTVNNNNFENSPFFFVNLKDVIERHLDMFL